MALIECPECHHEVSDKADTCPNCSYPFKSAGSSGSSFAARNPYRSGAIMGLIGSVAFAAILAVGYMSFVSGSPSLPDDESLFVVVLDVAALVCILANTLVFGAALVMAKSASRKALLGVSVLALVFAFVGTVGMVTFFNIMALCFGPLFLWEPILQLVGAAKMVSAALKTNE